MSVWWGGGGVGGWGLGSGGFLSDVFFFQIGGPITGGLISGRGAYIGGRGVLSDEVFNPSRWAYNFGLISVRGLMGGLGGWRGGLLSYVLLFQVGGPITLGLISGSLW